MKLPIMLRPAMALLGAGLLVSSAVAYSHKHKTGGGSSTDFAYYMLVLSYAPDFCDQHPNQMNSAECGKGRHVGFVVHGLWPQGENSRGPERCGSASPVGEAVLKPTLQYIPTESLIQHEWTDHGTCSGLTSDVYFAGLRKARDSVKLPSDLGQPSQTLHLSAADVEAKVAAANPTLPAGSVRTSCYANGELEEVRICFNKDLSNLSARPCGQSAGECKQPGETLLPVR